MDEVLIKETDPLGYKNTFIYGNSEKAPEFSEPGAS